jgi:hypothetical protein
VKETIAYCDLDDKDARRPGVAVLRVDVEGVTHVVDVCQVHLTLLGRLPTGTTVRGRRRGARRVAKRAPAKAARPAAAPAKRVAKKAAKKAAPARKVVAKKVAKKVAKAPAKRAVKATRASATGRVAGSRRDQQQRIAAARDWARAQGRSIADKGRLPAGLLQEFARASR